MEESEGMAWLSQREQGNGETKKKMVREVGLEHGNNIAYLKRQLAM